MAEENILSANAEQVCMVCVFKAQITNKSCSACYPGRKDRRISRIKFSSYILHEQFPFEQFNAPEISSMDAFREAATEAICEMRVISTPVQSAAVFAISNVDNAVKATY